MSGSGDRSRRNARRGPQGNPQCNSPRNLRGRNPRRDPCGHRRPAAVRQGDAGLFELLLTPGTGVPDLVAAAGCLPPGVVYAGHRQAAPGDDAAVLLFQPPSEPVEPAGAPERSPTGGGPSPLPASAAEQVTGTVPVRHEWAPDVVATAGRSGGTPSLLEEVLAAILTPAALDLQVRLLVRGLAHCDAGTLVETVDLVRRRRRMAHRSAPIAA